MGGLCFHPHARKPRKWVVLGLGADLYWDSRAGGVCGEVQAGRIWLAAYTRARHEGTVADFCRQRGMEVFYPTQQSRRCWSDRKKLLTVPLFPSYVFLRLHASECTRAMHAPGFLWFVHTRQGPVQVADAELSAVQRMLESGMEFERFPWARLDQRVEIVRGPLRGHFGYLVRNDPQALVLQVAAIRGCMRVILPDLTWVHEAPSFGPGTVAVN